MAYIISIANQKGGIGKSTTAQALGGGLYLKGYKTLLIDLDPQGNTTYTTGADSTRPTAYELLSNRASISEVIQSTDQGEVIPASDILSNLDLELNMAGKEYKLKEALEPVRKNYDYIIIDTPPALGILTINALTASNSVIIPTQADIYNLQGIGQLFNTIQAVKTHCNPNLKIQGILLTRYHTRTILNRDMGELIEETAKKLNTKLYKTFIRESVTVREAQAIKQTIFTYAPKSNPSKDYISFIDEVIERSKGNE